MEGNAENLFERIRLLESKLLKHTDSNKSSGFNQRLEKIQRQLKHSEVFFFINSFLRFQFNFDQKLRKISSRSYQNNTSTDSTSIKAEIITIESDNSESSINISINDNEYEARTSKSLFGNYFILSNLKDFFMGEEILIINNQSKIF